MESNSDLYIVWLHVRSLVMAELTSAVEGRWEGGWLYMILLCGVTIHGVQTETWLSWGQRWRGNEWCALRTVYTCGDLWKRDVWNASDPFTWPVSPFSWTVFLRLHEFYYCFGSNPMTAPVLWKKHYLVLTIHSEKKWNLINAPKKWSLFSIIQFRLPRWTHFLGVGS